MIAQRFRALGWVAGIASASCGLYLISLQVAAERAKLEAVDARIAAAQRDMRALQTELGTRANLRQLQKWNDDVLSLATPRAAQYLTSEAQLAGLEPGIAGSADRVAAPQAVMVAAAPSTPKAAMPAPVRVARAETPPAAAVSPIRRANYVPAEASPRIERVAMIDRAVIGRGTLGDLVRTAAEERRKRP
ncbi:hypothetical protein [Sphingomonas sp. SUN039]|uniref:hypothetical protein n=1 Tax=Sphingomonas sp. SUN039 TaxID=2937787 RepID=UPI00216458E6|nr:hypothetical protein [Sphingomonas sp. SUN039]UVO54478.1 hypothetical protein M0209_10210 [Sphingomonas sp. SUN039]